MFLTMRILHIVTGIFWAGSIFFLVSFLQPAFKDAGPDGAKVFGALRARRMFTWIPALALVTIISGLWLYMIRMGGGTGWARTREAMSLGTGAIAAVVALIIGWFVMRASTLRAADLAMAAGPMPAGAERDAKMAEVMALRGRATMSARAVATLLLIAVITMAIARYI